MGKIKVMSEALSNRIAAGEVIERPASVVKELAENSIDAGAVFVDVEIERAGSKLIAVTDDGCGMDAEDAVLSLSQHGTSKLLCEDDLDTIMTLGFRGEALPSIASVSCFSLKTRRADTPEGTEIFTRGGAAPEIRPCAAPVGTRIEVRDLFFNLPARKKFLKSAATEEHHIEEMISLLAIGHPETGFRLKLDGRTVFHSPASGKIEVRLRELFGKSFVEKMLFFEHRENGIHISGCVAAPGFTRPSRRDQRVFINSRPVEAQAVYRGIRDGYGTMAESGRYNPVILFLEIAPGDLDVNVHPAKREVRFRYEYRVTQAVAAAVSSALRQMRAPTANVLTDDDAAGLPLSGKLPVSMVLDAAEISYRPPSSAQPELIPAPAAAEPETDTSVPAAAETEKIAVPFEMDIAVLTDRDADQTAETAETGKSVSAETVQTDQVTENRVPLIADRTSKPAAFSGNWPTRVIGVLDKTFILGESNSGLVLIDQHAAHERVMFERILDQARQGTAVRQPLLLPAVIELSRSAMPLVIGNKHIFEQLGFDVEPVGSNTLMLNSLPSGFDSRRDAEELFNDMLDELLENSGNRLPVALEYVARAACRAAVKAHDELSADEIEKLLQDLQNCRQGTLCPHGRPTMITISLSELSRRFQRS